MRFRLFAMALLFAATCFGQDSTSLREGWGRIEGVVLDGEGNALGGATITAWGDTKGVTRPVTQYFANDKGEFAFPYPALDSKVWLLADKKSAGYPYAVSAFYEVPGQQFPFVAVKAGETTKDVVIRVGPKAAHIKYVVVDDTGQEIRGGFTLERLDQPERPLLTSEPEDRDLLAPPGCPFRMTFEAKGYKPWHYGGDKWQGEEGIISLKPGAVLNLTIHMQRVSDGK